jgi:hypothetical protein
VHPAETIDPAQNRDAALVVDIALGVASKTLSALGVLGRPVTSLGGPWVRVALRPPLLPAQLQPATWLRRAARRGAGYRSELMVDIEDVLARLIPVLVTELLNHVDLTHLVQENVDVVVLAEEVIAEIDLPSIIRDSTGAVASDTLLGVRMQSIFADEAIAQAMDRFRLRLGRRTTSGSPARTT